MARKRYDRMPHVMTGATTVASGGSIACASGASVDAGADGDLKVSAVSATGAIWYITRAVFSAGDTSAAGKVDSAAFSPTTIPAKSLIMPGFIKIGTEWTNNTAGGSGIVARMGDGTLNSALMKPISILSGAGAGYKYGANLSGHAVEFSSVPFSIASAALTPTLYVSGVDNTSGYSAGVIYAYVPYCPRPFGIAID